MVSCVREINYSFRVYMLGLKTWKTNRMIHTKYIGLMKDETQREREEYERFDAISCTMVYRERPLALCDAEKELHKPNSHALYLIIFYIGF